MKVTPQESYRKALQFYLNGIGWGGEFATSVKANISQTTLNRIKTGKRKGKISTLICIAEALDTTYEDMLAFGRELITGETTGGKPEIFELLRMAKVVLESENKEIPQMLRKNIETSYEIMKKKKKKKKKT